jgi:hypothetical protein
MRKVSGCLIGIPSYFFLLGGTTDMLMAPVISFVAAIRSMAIIS